MVKSACVKKMFCGCLPLLWMLLLSGCANTTHHTDYYGAFFYDTATIGIMRFEYDYTSWQGVTGPDGRTKNIVQWVDLVNMATSRTIRSINIAKKLSDMDNVTPVFVKPWLLYNVPSKPSHVEMRNLETGKKCVFDPSAGYYPTGISSKGNFAMIDHYIISREDGYVFRTLPLSVRPIFLEEDSMILISHNYKFLLKDYLNELRVTDTIGTYFLRMVANNRYAVVPVRVKSKLTGDSIFTCGLITRSQLLQGDLSTDPLVCDKCSAELLPEKKMWLYGDGSYGTLDSLNCDNYTRIREKQEE